MVSTLVRGVTKCESTTQLIAVFVPSELQMQRKMSKIRNRTPRRDTCSIYKQKTRKNLYSDLPLDARNINAKYDLWCAYVLYLGPNEGTGPFLKRNSSQ